MNEKETAEFWALFREFAWGGQRKGQAMMNALRYVAPELYDIVSQSQYDVFYRDTSQDIYRFRDYVGV